MIFFLLLIDLFFYTYTTVSTCFFLLIFFKKQSFISLCIFGILWDFFVLHTYGSFTVFLIFLYWLQSKFKGTFSRKRIFLLHFFLFSFLFLGFVFLLTKTIPDYKYVLGFLFNFLVLLFGAKFSR